MRWRWVAIATLCLLGFTLGQAALAQTAGAGQPLRESFEGAKPSWQIATADVQYRLDKHQRAFGEGRSGTACETLAITAANGSYVYVTHPIDRCRVVSELSIRMWLKASRADLQILARVVLPGAHDSAGQPISALVRGSFYKQPGVWQEMRLDDLPQLVERQVRILRAQHGPQIDARGAYLDLVALNVYGGQGATQVWIDDLEISGAVPVEAVPAAADANRDAATSSVARKSKSIRLSGTILTVDGRPIFPRIVEHQGEPLSLLAEMGFSGVRVNEPPSADLLAEAEQSGIWIVGPPPPISARDAGGGRQEIEPIPAAYDRVLAWSLGQGLTARDFENIADKAKRLRAADRRRPLLFAPETDLLRYSRELRDLLSVYRFPLSTSLQLTDYGNWLRERPRLARPGTPFWTVVQTQPAASLRAQWAAFGGTARAGGVDGDALRLLAFTAVASGVRGLEFASHLPLDGKDAETRRRALALSVLNAELDLVEPWAAAGSYVTTADSNDPHVKAVLLQYESSRLLLIMRVGPHAQYLPLHSTADGVSFVVPAVPESHELIELTAAGVRPLKHKRVTGGTLITLDDFDTTALVLITPDPLLTGVLSRRLAAIAQRTAEWQRELVARTLAEIDAVERRLPAEVREGELSAALLSAARVHLDESVKALSRGDRRTAFVAARKANTPLGQLQRKHWERAAASLRSSVASPFVGSFTTLPEHWQFMAALSSGAEEANRLPAGDFEDLQAMVHAGWRHLAHPLDGIEAGVELAPGGTSGRSCLRLDVRATDRNAATALVETTPVWITSPPLPVERGEVVCIRARVRVAAPIRGSVDGLMIVDSLGGEALAERIGETSGWHNVLLYRAAPRDGEISVTFALTGFGEALVDDVTISTVRFAAMPAPFAGASIRRGPGAIQSTPGSREAPASGLPPAGPVQLDQAQRMQDIFRLPRR